MIPRRQKSSTVPFEYLPSNKILNHSNYISTRRLITDRQLLIHVTRLQRTLHYSTNSSERDFIMETNRKYSINAAK